jgi:hypothetical protein
MGVSHNARTRRHLRRPRRLSHSRRGVVAVVGTILALLVFYALFGVFLTQYVPLWMAQNESTFSNQAEASMALLKSEIDEQYALGAPSTYAAPFTINSAGIPLIAQPTQATLSFLPPSCSAGFYANGTPKNPSACVFEHLFLGLGPGSTAKQNHPYNQTVPTSLLEMQLPNRYFTPQTFVFEDDGLVQMEPVGHQWMAVPPPLNVSHVATNTSVTASFLQLSGNYSVAVGVGSREIYSQLLYTQAVTSSGRFATTGGTPILFNLTFEVGTHNPCGWWTFFSNLVNSSGLSPSKYSLTPSAAPTASACQNPGGATEVVSLSFLNINYASVFYAGVQLSFSAAGV